MIKIDASSFFPRRLGVYLLGIIPGLLFELSVALADPQLGRMMIDRVRQIYPFQPYALLILFIISSLVVGQTFFLLSWFADLLISYIYGLKRSLLLATFGSDWLYRLFGKLQGIPPKRSLPLTLLSRAIRWGRDKRFAFEIRPVLKCHRLAATQLLIGHYGIKPSKGLSDWVELEWQVWSSVLGRHPPVFREAFLTMRIFLGCGLSGIAALYVSPSLHNRYFVTVCAVFIASGCIQSADFAKQKFDPMRGSISRLVSILEELSRSKAETRKKEDTVGKNRDSTIDFDADMGE